MSDSATSNNNSGFNRLKGKAGVGAFVAFGSLGFAAGSARANFTNPMEWFIYHSSASTSTYGKNVGFCIVVIG